MKKNRIIKEQINVKRDCTIFQKDKTLTLACEAGCLPAGAISKMVNGKPAAVAKTKTGQFAAVFGEYVEGVGGKMLVSNNPEFTGELTEKTWVCANMQEIVNASMDKTTIDVINKIKADTRVNDEDQVLNYSEGMARPDLIKAGWTLTPLTKAPFYEVFKDLIETRLSGRSNEIVVWVRGVQRQYTGPEANRIIAKYKEKNYAEGKPPGGVDQAGYIPVNLQDEYPQYFKEPYWMYYDANQMSDNAVINALRNAVNASKEESRKKSACRTLIVLYADAHRRKLDMEQITLDTFKPAIVNCVNSYKGFPFINKKIESLRVVNPITTQSGKSLDYSWDPKKTASQKVVREGADVRIGKILRESLLAIKEVKKKLSQRKRI